MRLQSTAVVALIAVTVLAAAPSSLAAADGYQMSSSDADSMPERTVEFQDGTFTIDSLITADPGDEISVDVSAPDEVYRVYVYNSEEQIVDSKRGNGSQSFSFDLSGYDPGSYPVTVYHDGDYEVVQPLVVEGYDVSLDAPSTVERGESATVEIEVEQTAASSSPAHVRAVIANDEEHLMINASESDGSYVATFDGDELSAGSYTVYGAAQDANTAMGRNEVLGVSERSSLSVEDASTPTATPTPDSGGDGGDSGDGDGGDDNDGADGGDGNDGADGDGEADTPTPTATATPEPESTDATPTATATATDTPSDDTPTDTPADGTATDTPSDATTTAQPTERTGTDEMTSTQMQTATPTVEQTDDSIDPVTAETQAGTAEEAQTGTADSGPGFTLVGAGLAVLVGAVLLIRRE
ncbi:hypothetical protein [Halosimplex sp. TS25]|uniref:hypothetical protein n=1 Tax=Halosimplex rarum TaxID=3396619 RepID=UPI0039E77CC8